uniref:Uncharacterized protein n=1 Tax=Eutreptiella gymnastica TaxID=73025 RepID=A0A7S1NFN0_9EUGL|mmetsp:Transcript_28295/g.50926  ORF Transcript_28295/g.50926 Transcript_28295/m.50926 type:complete len:141 (+) Transcript_28295:40-462(+)
MSKLTSLLTFGLVVWIAFLNVALHAMHSSAQNLATLHDEVLKLDMEERAFMFEAQVSQHLDNLQLLTRKLSHEFSDYPTQPGAPPEDAHVSDIVDHIERIQSWHKSAKEALRGVESMHQEIQTKIDQMSRRADHMLTNYV